MDALTQARSRSRSFKSEKSKKDRPAHTRQDSAEKSRRDSFMRGESKANPNAAINEAQPQVLNVLEESTLSPLRDVQHKDVHGNLIAEPDLANPTRSRWERPLDTIRSFEKAIDGDYRRPLPRSNTDHDNPNSYASRRSSYLGGYDSGPSPSRFSHYGNRRPDSYYDGNGNGTPPRPQRYGGRSASDMGYNGGPRNSHYGGYNQHGYHQSHDTVNTGVTNNSDSTGQWNNSTNPSSESSSLDKAYGTTKPMQGPPEPPNGYGYDGFGGDAIEEEHGGVDEYGMPPQAPAHARRANGGAPGVPSHSAQGAPPRKVIQLGGGGGASGPEAYTHQGGQLPSMARTQPQEEKRKSWFKRRLSKRE